MVAFRQPIRPGDVGSDVLAVKRALRKMGQRGLAINLRAGAIFVRDLERVQRQHRLTADGIYGPRAHAIIAPHFDLYGAWLYSHARIRSPYVNPFRNARIITGRIDMGVDFHGTGPILAIGNAVVIGNSGHGWPGGEYLLYRLLDGPHRGRYVYLAEGIIPTVRAGQHVRAGQGVAVFRWDAFPGRFPGIETGWSSSTLNRTWAAATTGYREGERTRAGLAFARLLRNLGVSGLYPGPGSTFPD